MLNNNETEEYRITYNNRRKYIARLEEDIDIPSSLEQLSKLLDPEDIDFSIACLSEFYHYKFVNEVVAISKKKIDLVKSEIGQFNKEQQENINFLIRKLEHRIANCEFEPSFAKTSNNTTAKYMKRKKEDFIWFKTGIQLANGKAYELNDKGYGREKIATTLGFKESDGVYFSESIGGGSTRIQNLYSRKDRYNDVYEYCIANDIEICEKFLEKGKNFCP